MSEAELALRVQAALRVLNPERLDIESANSFSKKSSALRGLPKYMLKVPK
jgi:hypothetical protein